MANNYEQNQKKYSEFNKKYRQDIKLAEEYITEQIGIETNITTEALIGDDCETFFIIQIYLDKYQWKYIRIYSSLVESRINKGATLTEAILQEILFKLTFETKCVHKYEATLIGKSVIDLIHNSEYELFGNEIYLHYDGEIFGNYDGLNLNEITGFIVSEKQAIIYIEEGRYIINHHGIEFVDEII